MFAGLNLAGLENSGVIYRKLTGNALRKWNLYLLFCSFGSIFGLVSMYLGNIRGFSTLEAWIISLNI